MCLCTGCPLNSSWARSSGPVPLPREVTKIPKSATTQAEADTGGDEGWLEWKSSKKCQKIKILTFRFFVQNWFLWCQSDVLSWLDMSKVSITHIFRLGLKLGCSEAGSDEEEDDPKPRVWKISKSWKNQNFDFSMFCSELVPTMSEWCFELFRHV